jgi:hypothetical protein
MRWGKQLKEKSQKGLAKKPHLKVLQKCYHLCGLLLPYDCCFAKGFGA